MHVRPAARSGRSRPPKPPPLSAEAKAKIRIRSARNAEIYRLLSERLSAVFCRRSAGAVDKSVSTKANECICDLFTIGPIGRA